jgi:predicted DsbA family dithiol-disulfide isomerase
MVQEVNDEKKAFGRGVSGVPFFIINKEEGLSGAQPAETFIEIFQELLKA